MTFFLVVDFLNHGFVSLAPQGWDRNRSNAEGWYLLVALALQRDSCSKWVYNVVRSVYCLQIDDVLSIVRRRTYTILLRTGQ
jgi:hypothetical protein